MTLYELFAFLGVTFGTIIFAYITGFYAHEYIERPHGATVLVVLVCSIMSLLMARVFVQLWTIAKRRIP